MSCAIVRVMHVTALQLSFERLGVGRPLILAAVLECIRLSQVCDREHVEETGGAVEQDGLNNTFVQWVQCVSLRYLKCNNFNCFVYDEDMMVE